jgi:hypothetical protein
MSDDIEPIIAQADTMQTEAQQTIDRINNFLTHEVQDDPNFVFGEMFLDLAAQVHEGARDFYERLAGGTIRNKLGGRRSDLDRWDRAVREHVRKRASEAKAAAAAAAPTSGHRGPGRPLELHDPPPCAQPVDGVQLLTDLVATIHEYMIVTEGQAIAVALWIVWSHLFRRRRREESGADPGRD